MIQVTKTYLPPMEEYQEYLKKIWDSAWVTNNGPLVKELEQRLKEYFGVKHLFFASNGTIVLQMALKALDIKKEVITTPFSYVATTTSVLWENCTPVFADIDPITCCIDPRSIEERITANTQAILATHVYGIPCDIDNIERIAKKHNLKVIYDAAHTFGCTYRGKSLVSYGDVSTLSFHATKLFHTIEGGAIITNDDEIARKLKLFRSFGHVNDDYFSLGINGKNSEFHAAMGLCLLDRVPEFMRVRKELVECYNKAFAATGDLVFPLVPEQTCYNYSYYPVIFRSQEKLLQVKKKLEENGIGTRRYFYPSLNTLPYVTGHACPVSESVAVRVLCLPLYYELDMEDVKRIAGIVLKEL